MRRTKIYTFLANTIKKSIKVIFKFFSFCIQFLLSKKYIYMHVRQRPAFSDIYIEVYYNFITKWFRSSMHGLRWPVPVGQPAERYFLGRAGRPNMGGAKLEPIVQVSGFCSTWPSESLGEKNISFLKKIRKNKIIIFLMVQSRPIKGCEKKIKGRKFFQFKKVALFQRISCFKSRWPRPAA